MLVLLTVGPDVRFEKVAEGDEYFRCSPPGGDDVTLGHVVVVLRAVQSSRLTEISDLHHIVVIQ